LVEYSEEGNGSKRECFTSEIDGGGGGDDDDDEDITKENFGSLRWTAKVKGRVI
jgi:hypothetical protein